MFIFYYYIRKLREVVSKIYHSVLRFLSKSSFFKIFLSLFVWIFKRTHFAKSPKEIMNELKKHRDMTEGTTDSGAVENVAAAKEIK